MIKENWEELERIVADNAAFLKARGITNSGFIILMEIASAYCIDRDADICKVWAIVKEYWV